MLRLVDFDADAVEYEARGSVWGHGSRCHRHHALNKYASDGWVISSSRGCLLKTPVLRWPGISQIPLWAATHQQIIRNGPTVKIPACHAGDRGSTPRSGDFFGFFFSLAYFVFSSVIEIFRLSVTFNYLLIIAHVDCFVRYVVD